MQIWDRNSTTNFKRAMSSFKFNITFGHRKNVHDTPLQNGSILSEICITCRTRQSQMMSVIPDQKIPIDATFSVICATKMNEDVV